MSEKRFSEARACGHCGNTSPMEIVNEFSQVESYTDQHRQWEWEAGPIYQLLLCPGCQGIILRTGYWHDGRMDPDDFEYKDIYPITLDAPKGLPASIKKALRAANKVKNIDANAYAVLMGRLLELVCEERNASGKTLTNQLSDLSNNGEIPGKIVEIAGQLRILRNIGAHSSLGELTKQEIPILDSLCRAILEYVYTAPFLVREAEQRIKALKKT